LLKGSRDNSILVLSSDLPEVVELAYRGLLLVDRGASERGAILQVTSLEPSLRIVRHRALDLILGTVREQDMLDGLIQTAIPDRKIGAKIRCLFRLATHLMLRSHDMKSIGHIEKSFRNMASSELLPSLQLLMGVVIAYEPNQRSRGLSDVASVGLETHHPSWWVGYCFRLFGRDETIRLLSAGPRPRYIRVNSLRNRGRITLPASAKTLASKLIKVESSPTMYTLNGSPSAFSNFFSQGLFQMQDLASFLAVKAASPAPGESVLDLCTGSGGKTTTLAQLMKNRGKIVSIDYSCSRMRSWKREVTRLGVRIAEPVVSDATKPAVRGSFDLILVDPPCTGTGVFDRYPSMKWHLTPESVERYSRIQQRILDSASDLLARDGRILYCTCSLTFEENENVVSTFLKSHLDFETRPVLADQGTPGFGGLSDCRRLWPHRDKTAGYFVALIQRVT
jgi:16S rRNA (cytosine967-C5)-methyltransferase